MARKSVLSEGGLLLDTHVLLWLSNGDSRLSEDAIQEIEKASMRQQIRLSLMTLWELGYLVQKKRISLAADLPDFWAVVLDRLAAKELKISAADVIQYHRLPAEFHGDPGDRFLVAQAISRNLRFLTADQKILKMKDQLHPAIIESCQA